MGTESFGKMIAAARRDAKLSQRALAERLITKQKPTGVWGTYIGQIEKGDKIPSDEVCLLLSTALDLDPDVVLLAAYRSRANSDAGKALFAMMERSLTDPMVRELLGSERPLAPILEIIANPEAMGLLADQRWIKAITRARKLQKKRDILATLRDLEAMNDKQWEATRVVIQTMDLQSSAE